MLSFTKTKTLHHILKEFHPFLLKIEKIPQIQRIIPGRIVREQSGRSSVRINFSYTTNTGLKYKLCKGSTAQELFIITQKDTKIQVQEIIQTHIDTYL